MVIVLLFVIAVAVLFAGTFSRAFHAQWSEAPSSGDNFKTASTGLQTPSKN